MSLVLLFNQSQALTKSLSDSITVADAVQLSVAKVLTDSVSVPHSISAADSINQHLLDSATVADAAPKLSIGKVLADSATPSDALSAALNKKLTDSVSTSDSISSSAGRQLSFSDSVGPLDAIVFGVGKALTDSTTPSDSLSKAFRKTLTDSTSTSDAIVSSGTLTLVDSVTLTDTLSHAVSKVLTDSVTQSDSLARAVSKKLADSFSLADSVAESAGRAKALSDSVTTSDSFSSAHAAFLTLADAIGLSDVINRPTSAVSFLAPLPASGNVAGGTPFTFVGSLLDMSGVSETFASGTLDPLKMASSVTGTGNVTVIPGTLRGTLQLDTKSTPNSTAVVRTVVLEDKIDVAVAVTFPLISGASNALSTFSLGLYAGASSYLRFSLIVGPSGVGQLRLLSVVDGATVANQTLSNITVSAKTPVNLRILHVGTQTYGFLSGQPVFHLPFGINLAMVEMKASNDPTLTSRMTASVVNYARQPVILFGSAPVTTLTTVNQFRVDGLTPPVTLDGLVDVEVDAWAGSKTFIDGFRYTLTNNLTIVRPATNGQGKTIILGNPTITGGQR